MRTEREIREKIEEYMDKAKASPWWDEEREILLTVVDTLLWVIEDASGKAI